MLGYSRWAMLAIALLSLSACGHDTRLPRHQHRSARRRLRRGDRGDRR
jgi:hypothetical protein